MSSGWLASALCLLLISGDGRRGPPPPPRITRVLVKKSARTMDLYGGDMLIQTYSVAVGGGGAGPKLRDGDLVTPTGHYKVIKHLPSHLRIFMRIDYPNAEDRARFARLKASGELPKEAAIGGDIGIHGAPPDQNPFVKATYLSHGCVVVENSEIDVIARMVADGTQVDIVD